MSGQQIQQEVTAALASLAGEVGSGVFDVAIIRTTGNPAQPWEAPTGTETIPVVANVMRYSRALVDGTLIMAGDRRVMVAANGPVPNQTDRLRINGIDYSIVNVMPYDPQGVVLYFEVQARV
jgi:hypothetical protein